MERVTSLAETLVIPEPAAMEILAGQDHDEAARWLKEAGKRFVRPAVAELPALLVSEIGAGERAVISWAAAHGGFVAVLDDREARVIAQCLGIGVLGTVGVVLRLKLAGLIAEANSHLRQIKQVGGYISDDLFREALLRAGEQP